MLRLKLERLKEIGTEMGRLQAKRQWPEFNELQFEHKRILNEIYMMHTPEELDEAKEQFDEAFAKGYKQVRKPRKSKKKRFVANNASTSHKGEDVLGATHWEDEEGNLRPYWFVWDRQEKEVVDSEIYMEAEYAKAAAQWLNTTRGQVTEGTYHP